VGKLADVLLFDLRRAHLTPAFNPVGILVHTAQGRDVATVVVDGRVVVEGGRATLVDEERIRREGAAAVHTLWTGVTGRPPGPYPVRDSSAGSGESTRASRISLRQ
jgi:5-methylthioadenosine/S-adenosylhomocysteine deaminase